VRSLRPAVVVLVTISVLAGARPARAQEGAPQAAAPPSRAEQVGRFFGGAAVAFGAHELGHLVFDVVFDAKPGIKKVTFAGVPFFAITHEAGLSPRREFTISSAGFWVQHVTSEWILTSHPDLRGTRAPFLKGMLAFDVLASVAYSGAAFAKGGPPERDTRAMAASLGIDERWVGALILAPALLDAVRYFRPRARWAVWSSRGVKAGLVLLVLK
jgi:hypothetical protein